MQDLFLTETAALADIVLPAASAYEKDGTVTNVCGEVLRLRKAVETMGAKTDYEIIRLIARHMDASLDTGGVAPPAACPESRPDLVWSSRDNLFTSGTLGRYSKALEAERNLVQPA